MIVKYHANGDPDSIWVDLQLREYEEFLHINGAVGGPPASECCCT